ncbi:MAG: carboxymuconolactone decarboxylase family protein [Acidobacteria bacterium ACB1]|nr:carboxymuconolactone decarboxylase family protein [Acidobacteria bacterium ACB1]RIJ93726.1 MAG: carboxymuconolactone decarboxylase family protein [Acidobacteriota bacterium]
MQRINYHETNPKLMAALLTAQSYLATSSLETKLLHLVDMRVSQMNGCAYCLDMHSKDLRHEGDTEQRLYLLSAWHEAREFFTPREQAALAWAEAVTLVSTTQVPDEVFEAAKKEFTDVELADLTYAITMINTWNRFNVAFRTPAGSYQPGQYSKSA